MKPSRILLHSIVSVLAIQITLMPVSFALKVEIKSNVNLREKDDSSLKKIGRLTKGSIVEIPDRYVVEVGGKPDLELTLNNWLRKAGELRSTDDAGLYKFDGANRDYYFPVRVLEGGKGSKIGASHEKNEHFVALKYLARKGMAVIVSEDVDLAESKRSEPQEPKEAQVAKEAVESETAPAKALPSAKAVTKPAPKSKIEKDVQQMMEADNCVPGLCDKPDAKTPDALKQFVGSILPALAATEVATEKDFKRTTNDMQHIYKKFNDKCGFRLDQFTPIIKERAKEEGVPFEMMLALMTQESSGDCYKASKEKGETRNVGLFQVNTDSSKIHRCSTDEKNTLRNIGSASKLSSAPQCLDNPLVNLNEALRIANGFKRTLTNSKTGFDEGKLSDDDLWRLVVSSFNGGAKWPLRAKKDLETFNRLNGTKLSAYNWEDLRVFYMRSWLDRDQQQKYIGLAKDQRSRKFSVSNLAYAENVMGRSENSDRPGLAKLWLAANKE